MKQKILYGCLPAKKDLRDYKLCSSNVKVDYPKEFILSNLPKVKNQGNVNSCCAHATSSILEWHDNNIHTLSTNFIYGIQKKLFNQCEMGMLLAQACKITQSYGDALEEDCPGNSEIPKCYKIAEKTFDNEKAMEKAYHFRTINYYSCLSDNDIKYALMNYGPVLTAIDWKEDYILDKDNVVIFNSKSNGGGHATVTVGWNTKGWIVQNSWSEQFGDEGRFILPYSYGFIEAKALVDYDNSEDIVLMKPYNNKVLDIFYKIANFFINKFSKNN